MNNNDNLRPQKAPAGGDSNQRMVKCHSEETEIVNRLTEAMRVADKEFAAVGGSTRHYVRDCLLPILLTHGLKITCT